MTPFNIRLTAWRQSLGLTQEELAIKAGIPRPNLSKLEREGTDIALSTLERISGALGLKTGQLLDDPPPSPFPPLDRHRLDEFGRALVSGERPYSPAINRALDEIANLIGNRLAAHGATGAKRLKRRSLSGFRRIVLYFLHGPQTVERLLQRAEKHLSHDARNH